MLCLSLQTLVLAAAVGSTPHIASRDSIPSGDLTMAAQPLLTVRPQTMATGTRTAKAGVQLIDSVKQTWVYVPPQCVGTRRCPLVVTLGGAAISAMEMVNFVRPLSYRQPLADRYGMILLAPEATAYPGVWDVIAGARNGTTQGSWTPLGLRVTQFPDADVRNIDAAIKRVLREFAIDPEKIAVEGFSNGGSYALFLGRTNPQVFSRIAAVSPVFPTAVDDPPHQPTQILISGGIAEGGRIMQTWFRIAHQLRQEGHTVELVPGLRGHVDFQVDKDYEWRWLAQSWHLPGVRETAPPPMADSDPVLTSALLTKLTTFWRRFGQEPDSIRSAARTAHEAPLALRVGQEPVSVVATRMTALAAQYPSVAADLRAAGLTAAEADRLRAAVIRVGLAHLVGTAAGPIAPTSVLGQNLALRETHPSAFAALGQTGVWFAP